MINFCMAAKEYEKTHEVSAAMILVCIFQFIYVADCLFYEVSEYVPSIQQNPSRVYKFLKPTQGVILTPPQVLESVFQKWHCQYIQASLLDDDEFF